jgi:hypothetical protein
LSWVLCDRCGQRLPWADDVKPPRKVRALSDLSPEELSLMFSPGRRSFPMLWQDRRVVGLIIVLVLCVVQLLLR